MVKPGATVGFLRSGSLARAKSVDLSQEVGPSAGPPRFAGQEKTPALRAFSVAGAGFEPATFGL